MLLACSKAHWGHQKVEFQEALFPREMPVVIPSRLAYFLQNVLRDLLGAHGCLTHFFHEVIPPLLLRMTFEIAIVPCIVCFPRQLKNSTVKIMQRSMWTIIEIVEVGKCSCCNNLV